jgi:hypothetical protein
LRERISVADRSFKKWESLSDIENYYLNTDPIFICLMDFTNPEMTVNMAYEYLNKELDKPSEDFQNRIGSDDAIRNALDSVTKGYLDNSTQIGKSFSMIV